MEGPVFKEFIKDTSGGTAVEYGLLIGLFALFLVTTTTLLGDSINSLFTNMSDRLDKS